MFYFSEFLRTLVFAAAPQRGTAEGWFALSKGRAYGLLPCNVGEVRARRPHKRGAFYVASFCRQS
jgi:hypothetical protein